MGPKKFWVQKKLGSKIFWVQNILGTKFFVFKSFFGVKINFWSKNEFKLNEISGQKNLESENFFGSIIIFGSTKFLVQKILGP